MRTFGSVDEFARAAGETFGPTEWLTVDQDRVGTFADATDDHQWIHVDPQAGSRVDSFGGTIAHGLLTLSLLPGLLSRLYTVADRVDGRHYGFNKVRLPAPVPVGSRIRLSAVVTEVRAGEGFVETVLTSTLEIEAGEAEASSSRAFRAPLRVTAVGCPTSPIEKFIIAIKKSGEGAHRDADRHRVRVVHHGRAAGTGCALRPADPARPGARLALHRPGRSSPRSCARSGTGRGSSSGHDSEVPQPNDYVRKSSARRTIVMTRDKRRRGPPAAQPLRPPRQPGLRRPSGQLQLVPLPVPRLDLPQHR